MTEALAQGYFTPTRAPERSISFDFLIWAPVLLFSMVAHEYAHAEAAYRQGDDTAYMLGRLTMNPLKHIDPFMTVLLPIVLWVSSGGRYTFGAAKPVPVNPRNYRRYVRGDVIVSLAGIATNLVLFVVFTGVFALVGILGQGMPALGESWRILQQMAKYGMAFNLILAFFNLIPIPPLDGSKILYGLLPVRTANQYSGLMAQYGGILLVVLLVSGATSRIIMPAVIQSLGLILGHQFTYG